MLDAHLFPDAKADMTGQPLSVFRRLLRAAVQERAGAAIPTSTPAQAIIVMETFFRVGMKNICILTGSLNSRIYGDENVLVEAKKFLSKPARRLDILLLGPLDGSIAEHPLGRTLRANDNLSVSLVAEHSRDAFPYHFTVVDSNAYRFKRDPNSHSSIVAFNDTEFATKLTRIFHHLQKDSSQLR